MRLLGGLVVVVAAAVSAAGPKTVRTFSDDPVGAPPPGFVFAASRQAAPDRWLVQREGDERFLAHTPFPGSKAGSALAILQDLQAKDLTVAVRLKLVGGQRSGGLVWRYRDPENFYMVRLELPAEEQEIGLYRVVHGNRIRIDIEDDLELDANGWYALKVVHVDDRIRVYLGGIKVLDAKDRALSAAGGVGLWSSGDSAAYFDDVHVEDRTGSKP